MCFFSVSYNSETFKMNACPFVSIVLYKNIQQKITQQKISKPHFSHWCLNQLCESRMSVVTFGLKIGVRTFDVFCVKNLTLSVWMSLYLEHRKPFPRYMNAYIAYV